MARVHKVVNFPFTVGQHLHMAKMGQSFMSDECFEGTNRILDPLWGHPEYLIKLVCLITFFFQENT